MSMDRAAVTAWLNGKRVRRTLYILMLIGLTGQAISSIFFRKNDFLVHRTFGGSFLAGEPYRFHQDIYPVSRAMINTLIAVGPLYLTRAVCFALAIAALYACCLLWRKMAQANLAASAPQCSAAMILATLIALPFIVRDLDECGLQIYVLFFLTAAGYALWMGKSHWCGFWLATAAVFKVSPFMSLPFLLWKRQWQAAAWMAVFVGLWAIAPAFYLGWNKTAQCHQRWHHRVSKISSAKQAYPSGLELEPPVVYNLSFAAAAARYLETYPEDHPLYIDHAGFFQFGNLSPLTAYHVVRGLTLLLGLVLAFRFWRKWQDQGGRPVLACEWAAMCLLVAVMAPVCWKQHLVLILPALFLSVLYVLAAHRAVRWRIITLGLIAGMIYGCRRMFWGKEIAHLLISYKFETFAVLAILVLVLTIPRNAAEQVSSKREEPSLPALDRAA